jgi:hypothetical protein
MHMLFMSGMITSDCAIIPIQTAGSKLKHYFLKQKGDILSNQRDGCVF